MGEQGCYDIGHEWQTSGELTVDVKEYQQALDAMKRELQRAIEEQFYSAVASEKPTPTMAQIQKPPKRTRGISLKGGF